MHKLEAALLGSAEPLPPPALAGAAGLAGTKALAFSSMPSTWSLEATGVEVRDAQHQVPGYRSQGGQLLRQPAEHLGEEERGGSWSFIPVCSTQACRVVIAAALTLDCRDTEDMSTITRQDQETQRFGFIGLLSSRIDLKVDIFHYGDDGESQGFNVLLESRSHGDRQLLQNSESLLDLENKQTF
ncbi:hypothetical protein EYF80_046025 [Liparis tanakae]|uniref:Uncharacterized protein n=1 Tax=Liparis tanakae TaxID=230148 RepID=A0A4Z2FRK8_9TELE|nr:hypothetical protein EYF80_046025 [Liparis tanakae]